MEHAGDKVCFVAQLVELTYHSLGYEFLPFTSACLIHDNSNSFLQHTVGSQEFSVSVTLSDLNLKKVTQIHLKKQKRTVSNWLFGALQEKLKLPKLVLSCEGFQIETGKYCEKSGGIVHRL